MTEADFNPPGLRSKSTKDLETIFEEIKKLKQSEDMDEKETKGLLELVEELEKLHEKEERESGRPVNKIKNKEAEDLEKMLNLVKDIHSDLKEEIRLTEDLGSRLHAILINSDL